MSSDKHSHDDDELNRLLRQARWPLARDELAARLGDHWRRLQFVRRRQRLAFGGLAIAASILLVVAMLGWRGTPTAPEQVASDEDMHPIIEAPETAPSESPEPAPATDRAIVSRDPNLYEQVVLIRTINKAGPQAAAISRKDREELVDELIAVMAGDAQANLDERIKPLSDDLPRTERLLWKIVRQSDRERRLGAARLLSRIGSPRSLPVLMELAADPAIHEAAMLGLGRLAADHDLARWASIERDAALRRQLLSMLLARNTPDAVGLYLAFVNEAGSRSEALGVIAEMENPPAELLLGYLESPQQPVRLAAALALSRVPDPAVVERVCASVAGISRREALIALLLSSSEKATGCLNEARENLYLVASVRAAEQQLDSLHIRRGGILP
jgi:HEAT repeat protein